MIFHMDISIAGVGRYGEIARILRDLADRVAAGEMRSEEHAGMLLRDSAGREIGTASFEKA